MQYAYTSKSVEKMAWMCKKVLDVFAVCVCDLREQQFYVLTPHAYTTDYREVTI